MKLLQIEIYLYMSNFYLMLLLSSLESFRYLSLISLASIINFKIEFSFVWFPLKLENYWSFIYSLYVDFSFVKSLSFENFDKSKLQNFNFPLRVIAIDYNFIMVWDRKLFIYKYSTFLYYIPVYHPVVKVFLSEILIHKT